jgi:hypothetical protein
VEFRHEFGAERVHEFLAVVAVEDCRHSKPVVGVCSEERTVSLAMCV